MTVSQIASAGRPRASAVLPVPPRSEGAEPLFDLYNRHFVVVPADTAELKQRVFHLRYQVLAEENSYLDPADYPDQMEWDEYDDRSEHYLLMHRVTGETAGTVRLILPQVDRPGDELQFVHHCELPDIGARVPFARAGEVSRFAVTKAFRRRLTDGSIMPDVYDPRMGKMPKDDEVRRLVPYITIGLLQGIVHGMLKHRLSYVSMVTEPTLLRLLQRFGIYFETLGPLVPLYGWRQPCGRELCDLLHDVHAERPDVWDILTDRGRLSRELETYAP